MIRRSRLEICLDILRIIKDGESRPTRIMYGANLSWKPLQSLLTSMTSQGLIKEIEMSRGKDKRTKKIYELTEKGNRILRYYLEVEKLITVYSSRSGYSSR